MTNISTHAAVMAERVRQLDLWGEQNHPDGTSLGNQEIADAARDSCEAAFCNDRGTWFDILLEEVMEASAEEDEDALYVELIQVAAVAESWADAIRRRQQARLALAEELENDAQPFAIEGDAA